MLRPIAKLTKLKLITVLTMKLPDITVTSLLLILASYSKGEMWNVNFPHRRFNATRGQSVTIPCNFAYPSAQHTGNVQVYWKKLGGQKIDIEDNDKNAFIYHPNETFVLEKYRGRTNLTGNSAQGSCTLKIQNVTEAIKNIYVRVIGKDDQYSFVKKDVSIVLADVPGATSETLTDEAFETSTMESTTQNKSSSSSSLTYTAIFVPVTALVVIIFVAGIVFCIRRKRAQSCTRQDSGYYVNVSRTPSNQVQREASGGKQDNKKQSEPKVIDEPVYINMQVPQQEMGQRLDHTDSVYANIDYTK